MNKKIRCNQYKNCHEMDCSHYDEHEEIYNCEHESLCAQPVCVQVEGRVKCV
jgi:hypothetical protein